VVSAAERLRAVIEGRADIWAPPEPVRAATVALLRDGPDGMEVYLQHRAGSMAAAAAMHVFPGGGVAAVDGAPGSPGTLLAAARRELAEETGVTLPPDARLVRFARWVTPEVLPYRHDTEFFAVEFPAGGPAPQLVGTESVAAAWWRPSAALAAAEAGELGLLPPTSASLHQLAAHAEVASALAGLAELPVRRLMPRPYADAIGVRWGLVDLDTGEPFSDLAAIGLPLDWRPLPEPGAGGGAVAGGVAGGAGAGGGGGAGR
jgi:8-oxo-dGTP pyrophosphatase MutT (NUDIX family)